MAEYVKITWNREEPRRHVSGGGRYTITQSRAVGWVLRDGGVYICAFDRIAQTKLFADLYNAVAVEPYEVAAAFESAWAGWCWIEDHAEGVADPVAFALDNMYVWR